MPQTDWCLWREAQVIAEHARLIQRNHGIRRTMYDWRHYLSVLQRKPGASPNGALFSDLPDAFKRLQTILLKRQDGDREMVESWLWFCNMIS